MPIGLGKKKSYLQILYLSKKHSYADSVIKVIENVKKCDLIKSYQACNNLIEQKNYNILIIDELTLNPTKKLPKHSFELVEKLYLKITQKNPKILCIVLMDKIYPEFRKFNFIEGTFLFLIKDETKMEKLSFIISLMRRRYYRSILFQELKVDQCFPVDLYNYSASKQKYNTLIKSGEKLSIDKYNLMIKYNINNLYVLSQDIYSLFDVKYETQESDERSFYYSERIYKIRKKYREHLLQIFNAISDHQVYKGKEFLESSYKMITDLKNLIYEYEQEFSLIECINKLSYPRWNALSHGINCCIYALIFNKIVKIANDEEIAFAALYHNIGLYDINRSIIDKSEKNLSLSEKSHYETHVKKSIALLQHKRIPINDNIKEMIYFHHENFDGTGYPDGLAGKELPTCASLLSLVGSFDYFKAYVDGNTFSNAKQAFQKLKIYNTNSSPLNQRFSPSLIQKLEDFFSEIS
jgi:HD-GYP domain-containing protein (c-di-GMP phosphodiesterase class II)